MSRFFRRLINKYFGGTRNFIIWVVSVAVTIYFIDTYVLTKERLESLVIGQKGINGVAGTRSNHPLNDKSKESPVNPQPPVEVKQVQEKPPEKPVEKVADKPPEVKKEDNKQTAKCGLKEACSSGQYAFSIRSGEGKDISPTICFDGNVPMNPEKNNGHRGINLVTVNDKTMKVEDTRYFDTYVEEGALLRYLKLGIQDNFIILGASFDEASANLGNDGKAWLRNYGVTITDKIQFRDAFVFVGQKGLKQGSGIQKLGARSDQEFADPVEVRGCIKPKLGEITKIDMNKMQSNVGEQSNVKVGEEQPQCGVKEGCGPDSFPVHIFSGKGNSEGPKLCVSGKYVLAKGLNDGGRGLNIVIVDPKTKDVTKVGHFDTYSEDSSNLEIFLEMMNDKEIIIAVAHDDASKNLNLHAQKLFQGLGSSYIDQLTFRDVWGFVGQKGIIGHSPIEQIEFAGPASSFPRPIDKKTCVPLTLQGSKIKPDPLAGKNEKRRKFCSKYDGYGDFCEVEHMDEALTPAPLSDKVLEHHKIFQVPIIVIPGLNHNAVRMQLETLLMQPGIKTDMVTVMYDEKFDESAALAELFNYKTAKLSSSTKYIFQVEKALEKVWELYPSAKHVIVLEEEVILAPDFLNFVAQCLDAVDKDDTLMGVSAWNDNGYEGVSTDPGIAYRADTFPGLGFLLKRSFYDTRMKGNMKTCCGNRSWDGWFNGKLEGREMVIPDVSRVYRRPYEGLSEQAEFLTELFNRARQTNLELKSVIKNSQSLTSAEYDAELTSMIRSSTALDTTYASDCLQERGLGFYVPETSGKTYSVYYEQSSSEDHEILRKLCKCFKLFSAPKHQARSLHKGVLRFTYKGNNMFFVGSASPFYQQKPSGYKEIKRQLS